MVYEAYLKLIVAQVAAGTKHLDAILWAMHQNDHNTVRLRIEELLDDPTLYVNTVIDGVIIKQVAPGKVTKHSLIKRLYSDFMNMYTKHLDNATRSTDAHYTRKL